MRSVDRFVVFNVGATTGGTRSYGKKAPCSRRTFTSYGDAAKATWRCSKQSKKLGVASVKNEPCLLLHGMPGSEKVVGRCLKGKCGPPADGDRMLIDRCGRGKKERRDLIAQRTKVMSSSGKARNTGERKTSPDAVQMSGARRTKKRRR